MQLNEQDLARLSAKAEETDNAANPQQPGTEEQGTGAPQLETIELTLDAEMAMLMGMIVNVLKPALPSLEGIYTPPVIQALAGSTAAVCKKHGWLQNGIGGKYGEELALGMIVVPLGIATYKGVTADIAAQKAAKPAKPAKEEKPVQEAAQ
jgi:hypothetical protein